MSSLAIVSLFILTVISSINSQCIQSSCTAHEPGSRCCFNLGCCPAVSNVCCPNDPTNCCSTQFPICCGSGKGCCQREYPVCCSTHYCCSSGSFCCGEKCCRRSALTGLLIETNEGISKINQYQKLMMNIYRS
jgi:hypothetical protein